MNRTFTATALLTLLSLSIAVQADIFNLGIGSSNIATVNGEAITKEEFHYRLERMRASDVGGDNQPVGAVVLNQLIEEKLILQLAKEKGVSPTEAQIIEKFNLIKKEGALKNLEKSGFTADDIKRQISVRQAYINIVSKGQQVTDQEALNRYNKTRDTLYTRPEQIQIAVIACKDKKKILKALSMIKSRQDFGTVARQLSEDEFTKSNDGVAGWLARDDKRIPEVVRKVSFKTAKGKVSSPFQIPGDKNDKRWYVINVLDRRPTRIQPFEEVKNLIIEDIGVENNLKKLDFTKLLADYRKSSKIEIKDEKYRTLIEAGDKKE